MLKGIDVSRHNGNITWSAVKSDGIDFAIIRAGYGRTVDSKFAYNAQSAQSAGIPVGVYWFCYATSTNEAIAEADFCKKTLQKYKIDLPVYYDFEYDTERYAKEQGVTYTKASRTAIIDAFCDRIQWHGYAAGVYLNPDYITSKLNWSEISKYPLWIAQWVTKNASTTFSSVSASSVNTKYGKPAIWQFGKTVVKGIVGEVDCNYGYFSNVTVNAAPATQAQKVTFKKGDKVTVTNTFLLRDKIRGKTYEGGTFVVYYTIYTVMSVNKDRVVIGVNGTVTAAVNAKDIKKV